MGDLTAIRSDVVVQGREPVPEVVEVLRDMLNRAERGEVRAIALAGAGELDQPCRFSAKAGELSANGHTLMGQLFILKQDLAGLVR